MSELSSLLDQLYEAALKPELWHKFLPQLNQLIDAETSCIILNDRYNSRPQFFLIQGGEHIAINRYIDLLHAYDPFINLEKNKAVLIEEHIDFEQWLNSDFFHHCIQPGGLYYFIGVDHPFEQDKVISLRAARKKSQKNFSDHEKQWFNTIISHVHRAFLIYQQLQENQSITQSFSCTLHDLSVGIALIDSNMQLKDINRAALSLIQQYNLLLSSDNLLTVNDIGAEVTPTKALPVQVLLFKNSGLKKYIKNVMKINCETNAHNQDVLPYVLLNSDNQTPELIISVKPSTENGCYNVFFIDTDVNNHNAVRQLKQLYNLTDAESRLSLLLANGQSINEAAATLTIKKNTAKAHLRAIFQKTNISSQAQLATIVLKSLQNIV